MYGFMNQPANSVRSHCLSPARAKVAIDASLGPANYSRMFPELPSLRQTINLARGAKAQERYSLHSRLFFGIYELRDEQPMATNDSM